MYEVFLPYNRKFLQNRKNQPLQLIFNTFAKVRRFCLLELKIQLKNNTYVKKNAMTMQELIDEWLKSKKSNIGIKTY